MDVWETLVASALVGTNRQEPALDFTHAALADYRESLGAQSPTQQILGAAGLLSTYRAVGNRPPAATEALLEPAPAADLPDCSPLTATHLSAILEDSKYAPILPELLQLLARAQQTVPPEFLPLLLDLGKRDRQIRSLVLSILGSRGNWLVRQNPDWKYALGNDIKTTDLVGGACQNDNRLSEIWQTGTRSSRQIALRQWRKLAPAQAREAVAATWKQDKVEDRQIWLEVIRADLSLDDEDFLEIAARDRAEKVRNFAIYLLAQLPDKCRFRQRSTELVRQYFQLKTKGKSVFLDFTEPAKDDREWQICDDKGKAICLLTLTQVLSAADLQLWGEDIDRTISTAIGHKYNSLIFYGWTDAACHQQHPAWIKALLAQATALLNARQIQQLLYSLPASEGNFRDRFFTQLLTAPNFCETIDNTITWMVGDSSEDRYYALDRQWDGKISNLIVRQYHKYIQQLDSSRAYYYYQQQNQVNLIARHLDISVLPIFKQMQAELTHDKFNYHQCIELLEFRQEMQSAFRSP